MRSTLTEDETSALHWAGVSLGLKEARERAGRPLSADELRHFEHYQAKAHNHGFTDSEIRDYMQRRLG